MSTVSIQSTYISTTYMYVCMHPTPKTPLSLIHSPLHFLAYFHNSNLTHAHNYYNTVHGCRLTKHIGVQFPLKLQQESEPVKDNDPTNNSFRVGPPSRSSSFASNVDISDVNSPVKMFSDQENQDVNVPLI